MSRIGKAPITVPSGVEVRIDGATITVKGPKGELSRELPEQISVSQDDGVLTFERANDERKSRALHGLIRSLVANMVTGVSEGFR
ncbi:MAG: 50S ribosomal protein L6, partial [Actinomycetes bacterium]